MQPPARHRVILLALSSLLAVALGFWLIPPLMAVKLVQHGGYYLTFATTLSFGLVVWRAQPATGLRSRWTRADLPLAATCLVIAALWQVHGIHEFKILMDELVLNATAMSMHFDREVFVPLKTHMVEDSPVTLAGIVDKRPLFFPFVLSLVHDLTGYRSSNAFVLNAGLSLVLLFLVGRLGRRLGGQPLAGILAVILLGGLPLLALNATGGGFEVLNLVMILGVATLAQSYLAQPEQRTLDALMLGTVLLAQTRYESALYVPVAGIVMLCGWWRVRRPIISWGLIATPLLLLPVPLLQRLFEINKGFWQLPEGSSEAFERGYFFANLGGAMEFMFTLDAIRLGSPLLSVTGVVCLVFFIVYIARRWRGLLQDPQLLSTGLFTVATLAGFVLLLCYHWGQLQDFVASRLGLPLFIWFALCAAFAIGRWARRREAWIPILGIPAAWLILMSLPAHEKSEDLKGYLSFQEVKWQRDFIRQQASAGDLYVMPSSLPAIIDRRPGLTVVALAERSEQMAYHLARHTYQNVWVFQRIELDPETHAAVPDFRSTLGPEFILETIESRLFKPLVEMRLSRLKTIDLTLQRPLPADWKPQSPPFTVLEAYENPTPRQRFMREFLSRLP